MGFSIFTESCHIHHTQFKNISSTQKETPFPLAITHILPCTSPQPLAITNLFSISMDLPILDMSYKCNHTIHNVLCLASFTSASCFQGSSMSYHLSVLHWFLFHFTEVPHFIYPFSSQWIFDSQNLLIL